MDKLKLVQYSSSKGAHFTSNISKYPKNTTNLLYYTFFCGTLHRPWISESLPMTDDTGTYTKGAPTKVSYNKVHF